MSWDPTTAGALATLANVGQRRCGLHGDDTTGGRCGTCDQLVDDQAEAYMDAQRQLAEARLDGDL